LFAIPNELWKISLKRKKDHVSLTVVQRTKLDNLENFTHGSPAAESHLRVTDPPEVGFSGTCRLRAETKGTTSAAMRLPNIENPVILHPR
jgi:hypothetical protein